MSFRSMHTDKASIHFLSLFNSRVALFSTLSAVVLFLFIFTSYAYGADRSDTLYTNQYTLSGSGYSNGYASGTGNALLQPVVIKSIAVLPLENLTDDKVASDTIREIIKKEFKGKGLVYLSDDESVERFLARRRIRYTGAMTRVSVREMGKVLGVDAVLVGAVNYFSSVGDKFVVGVSCRLLNTIDGSIIWADNITYTGHDFEGLLGFGIIRSLDTLATMVVADLVKGIEDRFFINESAFSPFEIERVITFPTIGGAKGKREIRVLFLPLMDEPDDVRAIIGGEEITLLKVKENEYVADVYAPEQEGTYLVDIVARNRALTPFPFVAAAKIVVDDTPPKLALNVNRKILSPIKKGYVVFEPMLLNFEDIDEWKAEVYDAAGNRVRGDRGYGTMPGRLVWKGVHENKSFVKDGFYTFKFMVRDMAGNETLVSDIVMVKNNPPDIKVNVDVVDRIVMFELEHSPDEPMDNWTLSLKDKEGNLIKTEMGRGRKNFPTKFEYPIGNDQDLRDLVFTIEVDDTAGNTFKLTKGIPSLFSKRIPLAELKGREEVWKDF